MKIKQLRKQLMAKWQERWGKTGTSPGQYLYLDRKAFGNRARSIILPEYHILALEIQAAKRSKNMDEYLIWKLSR